MLGCLGLWVCIILAEFREFFGYFAEQTNVEDLLFSQGFCGVGGGWFWCVRAKRFGFRV